MIISYHWVQIPLSTASTKYSIHQVQHPPSTAFTKYSIYQVQHPPSTASTKYSIHWVLHPSRILCLPFILTFTCWPLTVPSASGEPPCMINHDQPAPHEGSKGMTAPHNPAVVCLLKYSTHRAQSWVPSSSSWSLDHGLQVDDWVSWLWPPNASLISDLNHSLQVRLWVQLHIGLQVHLQTRSIMTSECISE
jgi:hypothetical protein